MAAYAGESGFTKSPFLMHKQLRLISRRRLSVCPLSSSIFQVPPVPQVAFSRHVRRLPGSHSVHAGVQVFHLRAIGWWLWCFPSGRRQLSALPF